MHPLLQANLRKIRGNLSSESASALLGDTAAARQQQQVRESAEENAAANAAREQQAKALRDKERAAIETAPDKLAAAAHDIRTTRTAVDQLTAEHQKYGSVIVALKSEIAGLDSALASELQAHAAEQLNARLAGNTEPRSDSITAAQQQMNVKRATLGAAESKLAELASKLTEAKAAHQKANRGWDYARLVLADEALKQKAQAFMSDVAIAKAARLNFGGYDGSSFTINVSEDAMRAALRLLQAEKDDAPADPWDN